MGADVNIEEDGYTPLYHAVCNGQEDVVTVLLKHVSYQRASDVETTLD